MCGICGIVNGGQVSDGPGVPEVDDTTLILADQSRKALDQVRDTVEELLVQPMGFERAKEVARVLSEGTWTHDFAITYEAAKKLGLNVSDQMPNEVTAWTGTAPGSSAQPVSGSSQSNKGA